MSGKSTREVEKELVSRLPPGMLPIPSESVRMMGREMVEIKVVVSEQTFEGLNHLKNLLAHKNHSMSYGELMEHLVELGLKKHDPSLHGATPAAKVGATARKQSSNGELKRKTNPDSRYVPQALKIKIWKRDGGSCSYVSPLTHKKCGSKFKIQLDHKHPFALGGPTTEDNLRLLCANHNCWHTRDVLMRPRTKPRGERRGLCVSK